MTSEVATPLPLTRAAGRVGVPTLHRVFVNLTYAAGGESLEVKALVAGKKLRLLGFVFTTSVNGLATWQSNTTDKWSHRAAGGLGVDSFSKDVMGDVGYVETVAGEALKLKFSAASTVEVCALVQEV